MSQCLDLVGGTLQILGEIHAGSFDFGSRVQVPRDSDLQSFHEVLQGLRGLFSLLNLLLQQLKVPNFPVKLSLWHVVNLEAVLPRA